MSKSQMAREMRAAHPEITNAEIARKLKITPETVGQALRSDTAPETKEKTKFTESGDSASAVSVSRRITTVEQLIESMKIDLSVWEVVSTEKTTWEVGRKKKTVNLTWKKGVVDGSVSDTGKFHIEPLIRVSATFKKKVVENKIRNVFAEILSEFRKEAPKRARVACAPAQEDRMLELSLFDIHFGKLCWARETGISYDLKIARATLETAVDDLLAQSSGFKVSRVLLPVGNDYFNVDNRHQATTAGTLQDADGRWQKSFIAGRKSMVEVINRLREVAPVDVVMVSGNHDEERVFYLGELLGAEFSKTPDVTVNNEPTQRKYYTWGQCLLGLTHGNHEKHDNLPLIMATERAEDWGKTKYREWHVGHFHTKREVVHQAVNEFRSVRVRVIPSLSPPDAWHKSMGYEALRAAEAFVWDKNKGCVATLSHQP